MLQVFLLHVLLEGQSASFGASVRSGINEWKSGNRHVFLKRADSWYDGEDSVKFANRYFNNYRKKRATGSYEGINYIPPASPLYSTSQGLYTSSTTGNLNAATTGNSALSGTNNNNKSNDFNNGGTRISTNNNNNGCESVRNSDDNGGRGCLPNPSINNNNNNNGNAPATNNNNNNVCILWASPNAIIKV